MTTLVARLQTAAWRVRARFAREEGQTSSEYLVIAGVVVLIIIAILGVFRTEVGTAMDSITKNIKDAVK